MFLSQIVEIGLPMREINPSVLFRVDTERRRTYQSVSFSACYNNLSQDRPQIPSPNPPPQDGLFTSIKRSIVVSFRNLNFIILIILFQILIYYTTTLIPLEDFWKQLLDIAINSYTLLIIITSSLFYYQNVIKKT